MSQTTDLNTPISDEQDGDCATRTQKALMLVVCFFVFLIVYTLSVGPMAFFHEVFEFQQFQDSLELVYAPLIVIVENEVKPLSTVLKWYIGLFR